MSNSFRERRRVSIPGHNRESLGRGISQMPHVAHADESVM